MTGQNNLHVKDWYGCSLPSFSPTPSGCGGKEIEPKKNVGILLTFIFFVYLVTEFSYLTVHLKSFTFSFTVWAMNTLFLCFVNLPIFLWAKCPSNLNFSFKLERAVTLFFIIIIHYYYHRPGLRMLLFMTSSVEPIIELRSRYANIYFYSTQWCNRW